MKIFINERPVESTEGTNVLSAIRAFDPLLADRMAAGRAYATDGRGVRLSGAEPLRAGAILRVIVSSRRDETATDADA